MPFRYALGFAVAVVSAASGFAQGVVLADAAKPGDAFRYDIALTVTGKLKVERDGKPDALPLTAEAVHGFVERVEAAEAKGGVGKVVRHYATAKSRNDVGTDRSTHELAADRRLIVAQRGDTGPLHFSPAGPLTRDDLELVAEHFDTLSLPGLLPGKSIAIGDTWTVGPEATQYACQFEGLIKGDLTGKLIDVKDGIANFTITGSAEGLENGARAVLTIAATGSFDVAKNLLTELAWSQGDVRDQGPASPAAEVKATITVKRTLLAAEPMELNEAVRAKLPADGKIPDVLVQLKYADADGRYSFLYPRDWHIVGRTKDHLVLRLVEKGEFVAQATITAWKKVEPGMHSSAEEFKKLLAILPGWEQEAVTEDGIIATDPGRWLYRIAAKGKQDGLAVLQTFHLLAGPSGHQVAVTVLAKADQAAKVGPRDLALTTGIEFPAK